MDYNGLKIPINKTTPTNVREANFNLFHAKWNLPTAARHCGMTHKEMKMVFWEFLKTHPIEYEQDEQLIFQVLLPSSSTPNIVNHADLEF